MVSATRTARPAVPQMLLLALLPALRAGAWSYTHGTRHHFYGRREECLRPQGRQGQDAQDPERPFGGYAEPGGSQERGILGDKSKSRQIAKFEAAQDASSSKASAEVGHPGRSALVLLTGACARL